MRSLGRRLAAVCLTLVVVCGGLKAQTTGRISVSVKDQETGNPLVGVNVRVAGTALGAATGSGGISLIENVPAGRQRVRISIIGFKTVENLVRVEPGRTARLNVSLAPTEIEFESVVVTATRGPSLATEVSAPTEVLSAVKIARTNAQNVGEALSRSTGVFVKDYGAQGGLQSISVRGSSTSQVLVLVDGQRVSPANGSGIDFGYFAPDPIEQIEVVRGGNSALYGADASGGIINIITKSGKYTDRLTGTGKVTVGSFGNRVYAANFGQHVGRFLYYGTFNRTEVKSLEYLDGTGAELTLENTHYEAIEGFVKLGLQISDDVDITFRGNLHDSEKGINSLLFPSPQANLKSERQNFGLISNSRFGQRLRNKVQVYRNRLETEFVDPGNFQPESSIDEDVLTAVEIEQRAIITVENVLTYGYTFRHEKVDGTNVGDATRTQHAGFVQLESEWKLSDRGLFHKVVFIPAARFDDYSDFGSSFNPKIGVVLSRTGEHKFGLRANIGTSFRAPGFFDLYWPASPFFRGNPFLKAEESTDFDVGIVGTSTAVGGLEYELTFFRSTLANEIQTAPDETGVFTPQNLGSSKRKGFETRLALSPIPKTLRLEANYTYLKATNDTESSLDLGNTLIYRPENVFNLTATVNVGVFDLNVIFSYVDKRYSNSGNTASIGPYSYLEGNIGFRFKRRNVEYFARVETSNLGNRAVEVIAGFPQPKRTVGTTFGISF